MRKPAFSLWEQHSHRLASCQYDSKMPLVLNSKVSNFHLVSVALCCLISTFVVCWSNNDSLNVVIVSEVGFSSPEPKAHR